MTRQVTLVTGPPCSGKTTWVSQHANEGDLIIDWDQLAIDAGSPVSHDHPGEYKTKANRKRKQLEQHVTNTPDITAWIIRTLPSETDQHDAAQRVNATSIHTCDPGLNECIRRAHNDGRPPTTDETILRWYGTRAGCRHLTHTHTRHGKDPRHTSAWKKITAEHKRRSAAINAPCALCGRPIRYDHKAPAWDSFSSDHIISWTNGGPPYDLNNLQPTHLKCNSAKSNRDNTQTHRTSRAWRTT